MAGWAFKRWLVELHFTQNTDSLKKRKEKFAFIFQSPTISSMTTIGTPNNIDVLLHCHLKYGVKHERFTADAVQNALNMLLDERAIYHNEDDPSDCFRTTEKGRAWVASICATPPPVQCWKDANGKVIEL